jgi:hypothetical protein
MCTVTFRPTSTGFIFTSSRDERYDRNKTIFPAHQLSSQGTIIFPRDTEANGTWFASDSRQLLCLLNGAFKPHTRKGDYTKSRGIMVLEAFEYQSALDFIAHHDLEGMEPFTLIWVEQSPIQLTELRWDGKELFSSPKDKTEDHIWSSSTLYKAEAIELRQTWFQDWILKDSNPIDSARQFHYQAGKGDDQNGILLKRETKGTVSITSLIRDGDDTRIIYDDFQNGVKTIDLRDELEKVHIS